MRKLGKYSHLINFNYVQESSDGMGGFTESTSDKYTDVWANVRTIKGQRAMDFQQLHEGIWYDIECLYDGGKTINTGDTITFGSQVLTVHQAYNSDSDDWIMKIIAYAKQTTV